MSTPHIKSSRFTLVEKEDYKVDLEYSQDFAILHLPSVSKFTKTVYQDMLDTIENIEQFVKDMGYTSLWLAIPPEDSVLNKFVTRLSFEYRGSADNLSVYERT